MDSYNRGYEAGILGLSEGNGTQIGTATIFDSEGDADAIASSFYAIAYEWNGQKIISYRGTDNPDLDLFLTNGFYTGDVWNGYGVGGGSAAGKQAELALDFYKAVIGPGADPALRMSASPATR